MCGLPNRDASFSCDPRLMAHPWIAERTLAFDSSGIRKIFDLAAKLKNPVNLSIGQPNYDVPDRIKEALFSAVREGRNGYSPTQGIAPLRDALRRRFVEPLGQDEREIFVASGTSGGLVLTMLALVNPGDEVIFFDPYFVMYPSLVRMVGGVPVIIESGADFRLDPQRVADAITPRTKIILINSPGNPTGVKGSTEDLKQIAELAAEKNICLVSDEIYSQFCYDEPFVSPARFNPQTVVIDGFSKSHGMTGWRLAYVHGPREIIDTMLKLQQYTFVCAPHPVQWAGIEALEVDMTEYVDQFRSKRDRIVAGLRDTFELAPPSGAFYAFPKLPWGTGDEFIRAAIEQELLIIPGSIFSRHDTHFRISFAADDAILDRGIEILQRLARR